MTNPAFSTTPHARCPQASPPKAGARANGAGIKSLLVLLVVLALHAVALAEPFAPQRLTASGSHEEIGRAVGRQYAAELKQLHPLLLRVAVASTGQSRDALYRRAAALAEHIAAEDLAEVRGVAQEAGLRFEDVLFLNFFYNLTTQPIACRQLAAWGAATADGALIHARNLDWPDYPGQPLQRYNLILNVAPDEGVEHLLLTWPGLMSALTGTNREGLTVAFNALPNGPDTGRVAEPTFFTLKRVLRTCATLDEAVKLIEEAAPLGNGSVLISDADERDAVVVEIFDGRVGVRRTAGDAAAAGMIGNANHATREAGMDGLTVSGDAEAPTCQVARAIGSPIDAAAAIKVMGHQRVFQPSNLLSVIFIPTENRMLLSCGQAGAARGTFVEHELFARRAEQ